MYNPHNYLFEAIWLDFALFSHKAASAYLSLDPTKDHLDHIAFRTFDKGPATISTLEEWFVKNGYVKTGTYHFEDRKLNACSYSNHSSPIKRIFISELITLEQTPEVQSIINRLISETASFDINNPWCQNPYPLISDDEHQTLLKESGDYAAWVPVNGLGANHLTVNVDKRMSEIIEFLEANSFRMNTSGGKIKGGEHVLLEQCSTIADTITYGTSDGKFIEVPAAYCEFAKRWIDPSTGKPFDAFVETSANGIFDSTNQAR